MEFTTPPSGSPEQPILVQVGLVAQQEGVVAAAVRVSMSNSSSTPPQQPTSIRSVQVVQVVQVVRVRGARVALASSSWTNLTEEITMAGRRKSDIYSDRTVKLMVVLFFAVALLAAVLGHEAITAMNYFQEAMIENIKMVKRTAKCPQMPKF